MCRVLGERKTGGRNVILEEKETWFRVKLCKTNILYIMGKIIFLFNLKCFVDHKRKM